MSEPSERHIGVLGATGVGIGAIVGGGILVLAGAAFNAAGPSAVVAFALNGVIALLTALSFAEMSTAFPESGGAYVFAKKVLSVRAAFVTGWVLWFAYIVAGVLYALGFASYASAVAQALWPDPVPAWLSSRRTILALALLATGGYTVALIRKATGGGDWASWGKVVVFAVLILAGIWGAAFRSGADLERALTPFFAGGAVGVVMAMGFTFIALQGFEIIAAVAGEVKDPRRTLPKSMLLSLALALVIYLPLLLVVSSAGVPPGGSIGELSRKNPDTVMASAVEHYMGGTGLWLVMIAAVLSTLSALQANLLAASRVAFTMARDRTLPPVLAERHRERKTPVIATYTSALALVAFLFMIPDLSAAGAAASLIFLVSFALAHGTSFLARVRIPRWPETAFRAPWFPAIPIVGGAACVLLAIFQAVAVPAAGAVTALWLGLGVVLYLALFSPRAQNVDAWAQANDPTLAPLRGRTPLVLVPVANPEHAPALVSVASALSPPATGKVLLLTVVDPDAKPTNGESDPVSAGQAVLGRAIRASLGAGHRPEALLSVSSTPWKEISRLAREHDCEGLLLGRASATSLDAAALARLEDVMNDVDCDVSFLQTPPGWSLAEVRRVLVPVGGRSRHQTLRLRLLGSLARDGAFEVIWLQVLHGTAPDHELTQARRALEQLAQDTAHARATVIVERNDDYVEVVRRHSQQCDLLVLGLHRDGGRRVFGAAAPRMAIAAACATIIISRGR